MGPPCTVNMFSTSPCHAVSFFLWDFNTFPRFSLLLWQQQWAECSVRYHLCCITSGDWKWHSVIPEPLMADGTAEEGQEERGEEVRMWTGLAAGTHPSGTIMTGAIAALGWNGCDCSVMAGKDPCGFKKKKKKRTVEERHPQAGQVLFRTFTNDVVVWITGRKYKVLNNRISSNNNNKNNTYIQIKGPYNNKNIKDAWAYQVRSGQLSH